MKYWLLGIYLVFTPMFLFAQGGAEPYSSEWRKADSLLQRGFPESAANIAQSIYDRASQKGQQVQMMKAQLYLISAEFQRVKRLTRMQLKKQSNSPVPLPSPTTPSGKA